MCDLLIYHDPDTIKKYVMSCLDLSTLVRSHVDRNGSSSSHPGFSSSSVHPTQPSGT